MMLVRPFALLLLVLLELLFSDLPVARFAACTFLGFFFLFCCCEFTSITTHLWTCSPHRVRVRRLSAVAGVQLLPVPVETEHPLPLLPAFACACPRHPPACKSRFLVRRASPPTQELREARTRWRRPGTDRRAKGTGTTSRVAVWVMAQAGWIQSCDFCSSPTYIIALYHLSKLRRVLDNLSTHVLKLKAILERIENQPQCLVLNISTYNPHMYALLGGTAVFPSLSTPPQALEGTASSEPFTIVHACSRGEQHLHLKRPQLIILSVKLPDRINVRTSIEVPSCRL
jgi:hypothetical protein